MIPNRQFKTVEEERAYILGIKDAERHMFDMTEFYQHARQHPIECIAEIRKSLIEKIKIYYGALK